MRREQFYATVYEIVKEIPRGRVASYGQIALMIGMPHYSRMVGRALSYAPPHMNLPCHRVVNSKGRTAPHWNEQKDLLINEGVAFKTDQYVDMKNFQWQIF